MLPEALPTLPPGFNLPKGWEPLFLREFGELLEYMELASQEPDYSPPFSLPPIRDEDGWYKLCFGKKVKKENKQEENPLKQEDKQEEDHMEEENNSNYIPLLSVISQLDLVGIQKLLHHHVDWMENSSEITTHSALWFFALFSRLPNPVDADISFEIRRILRVATHQRAKLLADPQSHHMIPALSILITLASTYYGQADRN